MRFVFGLILGMAVGVSAGLLLAPQRGSETVRVLRERVQEWRGAAPPAKGAA